MSLQSELVNLLNSIAELLEIKNENPFKISAYKKGADALKTLENIEEKIQNDTLKDVKGIGKGLLAIIKEFYEKGYSEEYQKLLSEIPPATLEFMKIKGLGNKKIQQLISELNLNSFDELEEACKNDLVANLKGFSQKTQQIILNEIERIKGAKNKILFHHAEDEIIIAQNNLAKFKSIDKFKISGEFIRSMETISQIEIVAQVHNILEFQEEIIKRGKIQKAEVDLTLPNIFQSEVFKFTIESFAEIPIILHVAKNESDFYKLDFIISCAEEFLSNLNLELLNDNSVNSEEEIFKILNLDFVIPEMREVQYFQISEQFRKNSDLSLDKFKGLLHFHTVYSDGKNTLLEMRDAAEKIGFEYLAVCDHSKAAFYANGLKEEHVLEQKNEILKLNIDSKIKIFQGIESDILQNGNLDYENEFLSNFDFVVASVHSRFKMTEDEMTARIIKAVENPNTDVLGHATGRLLLERNGYEINIKKVIDACAQNSVAIEINANPHRLDLDWRNIFYAREKGCMFAVNPDAHTTFGIEDLKYGIGIARKGGLSSGEIINCMDLKNFIIYLNRKVQRKII